MPLYDTVVHDSSELGAERFSVQLQDGEPVWATCWAYKEYCRRVKDEVAFRRVLRGDGGGLLIPTRGSDNERMMVEQWMCFLEKEEGITWDEEKKQLTRLRSAVFFFYMCWLFRISDHIIYTWNVFGLLF